MTVLLPARQEARRMLEQVRVDMTNRMYIVSDTERVSFDVVSVRLPRLMTQFKVETHMPPVGTLDHFQLYVDLYAAAYVAQAKGGTPSPAFQWAGGLAFDWRTSRAVIAPLLISYAESRTIRIWYGDTTTGRAVFTPENGVGHIGHIVRSDHAVLHFPTLIEGKADDLSKRMSPIRDHEIVRIARFVNRGVTPSLYEHPLFHLPTLTIEPIGGTEGGFQTVAIERDPALVPHVVHTAPSYALAERWVNYQTGTLFRIPLA